MALAAAGHTASAAAALAVEREAPVNADAKRVSVMLASKTPSGADQSSHLLAGEFCWLLGLSPVWFGNSVSPG